MNNHQLIFFLLPSQMYSKKFLLIFQKLRKNMKVQKNFQQLIFTMSFVTKLLIIQLLSMAVSEYHKMMQLYLMKCVWTCLLKIGLHLQIIMEHQRKRHLYPILGITLTD